MRLILVFILTVSMVVIGIEATPTFYDSIPGIAQVKIAILYLIGERNQAIQSSINFLNMTHLLENVVNIDDSIPTYGHIKALVTEIRGDHERAVEIFEAAHRSGFILFGCIVIGSPLGGVAGLLAADLSSSMFERRHVGVIDHAFRIKNKTASQNIDLVLDLTLAATTSTKLKASVVLHPQRKFSVELKMKEIGDPILRNDPRSITSQKSDESRKLLIQPYTPMDHGKEDKLHKNKTN